jgi:RHS repeat-associated protein
MACEIMQAVSPCRQRSRLSLTTESARGDARNDEQQRYRLLLRRRHMHRTLPPAVQCRCHLGSTSLTLDASGNTIGEMKYTPFGETRPGYPSGTLGTDRRFTGQREESGLGSLYDYGARFYSPMLGRFLSADTIVPDPSNPQSLNRFTYVGNSPINRIDPSGHRDLDCMAHPGTCGRYIANPYVRFSGDWSYTYQEAVINSTKIIEYRLKSADAAAARREARGYRFEDGPVSYLDFCSICGLGTPGKAFQAVYGDVLFRHIEGNPIAGWAETHLDWVGFGCNMGQICYDDSMFTEANNMAQVSHNAAHELGHGIDQRGDRVARANLEAVWNNLRLTRDDGGFAGPWPDWQQSTEQGAGEVFADMFLGWTYNRWERSETGTRRSQYMNANIPSIIALAVTNN